MTEFINFTPGYYGSLIRNQQQALVIDNLFFYVGDGVSTDAVANANPKDIADESAMYSQVLYGCRLLPDFAFALCRRIDWTSGKVFAKYDSKDPYLVDKDFYVLTSTRRVYKCLDNNKGSPSTQEPSTLDFTPTKLSDGYIWQFLYSLTENQLSEYSLPGLMPIFVNNAVTAAAVKGTVSTIDIEDPGNYTATASGFIQEIVANNTFRIENSASPYNDIYNDSAFYISEGPGAGKLSIVSDYFSNTSGKYISTTSDLVGLSLASKYEIAPQVKITGDGLIQATAHTVMNGTKVDHIELLNRGMLYSHANAALVSNSAYSTDASLNINLSPYKGHGAVLYTELYANYLLIQVDVDNIVVDLPVNDISFSKYGLLRGLITETDPPALYTSSNFKNTVTIEASPIFGSYAVGDIVYKQSDPVCSAQLVFANSTHIIGVYKSTKRLAVSDNITTAAGISSTITSITQPDVRLVEADFILINNLDTTERDENSREICQMLIRVK